MSAIRESGKRNNQLASYLGAQAFELADFRWCWLGCVFLFPPFYFSSSADLQNLTVSPERDIPPLPYSHILVGDYDRVLCGDID